MTTFSQLVDDIVTELLRPDLRLSIVSYANQTIREMHFKAGDNRPTLYDANRYEDNLAVTTDGSWLWQLPSATRFQQIESLFSLMRGLYIEPKSPRISLKTSFEPFADLFYYRSGPSIAISGVSSGDTVKASYFMFPQFHQYKVVADRKIKYDIDSDSYVLIAGGGVPSEDQMEVETDWMLQRWPDVVKEGVRAKTWKRIGDDTRARMAFSAFENIRTAVWLTEPSSD